MKCLGHIEAEEDIATKDYVDNALQNAGTKIYVSATEPANWNAGDWWYEEVE